MEPILKEKKLNNRFESSGILQEWCSLCMSDNSKKMIHQVIDVCKDNVNDGSGNMENKKRKQQNLHKQTFAFLILDRQKLEWASFVVVIMPTFLNLVVQLSGITKIKKIKITIKEERKKQKMNDLSQDHRALFIIGKKSIQKTNKKTMLLWSNARALGPISTNTILVPTIILISLDDKRINNIQDSYENSHISFILVKIFQIIQKYTCKNISKNIYIFETI